MNELSPKARDLFARARREGAPSAGQKAALFSRIEARAAAPVKSSGWSWLVFGGSALVIVALLAFFASESSKGEQIAKPVEVAEAPVSPVAIAAPPLEIAVPEPQPEPEIVPEPPVVARTARVARTREVTESTTAPIDPAPAAVVARTESPSGCELGAETALIRAATMARRHGHFAQAEELLAEHRRDCPRGLLADQRNVLLARIACERGDLEGGRALGAAYRDGAYGSAIAQSCGEDR